MSEAGICYYPRAKEKCEIMQNFGSFYVVVKGEPIGQPFFTLHDALESFKDFENAGFCKK